MKKPIKYLMNGEYHYATVIDIGDIDKLKTKAKNNLVSAINELYTDGGLGGSGGNEIDPAILEQIEKLENQIELLKKDIGTAGLTESQIKELGDILSKYDFSYYEKLNKEIDEKIEAAKKTVQQSTSEIKEQVSSINKTISSTEKGLEDTKKKLADAELNIVNLESSYDEVTGELSKKVSSTTFDLLETTVAQNTRKIVENEKGIEESIKRSEYDLAQERVAELETLITKTAEGLSTKMTKKELQEEISKISQYKPNLLRNTKDWSGWKGSSEKAKVTEERYQHTSVVTQEGLDYMYINVDGLEQGKTYVASIWSKSESGISLSFNDGENHILSLENGDTKLSSQWKRYSTKFVAQSSEPHKVYFYSPDNTQTAIYYLAGAKIESGEVASGYIPHIDDIYAKTVDLSNEIKATAEGVELVTQSIEKQNEEIEQNTNSIKNTSKELSQSLKKIKEVGDELEQSKSEWKATAEEIKQKVSSTDLSKMMDGLESQSRNLQRNGSFIDNLNGWTASKEWKVKDINGVNYASVARAGATKDLDLTLFSDYAAVKKDMKISVGFDMYIKSLAAYNVQKILRIELYDISNKRVDYKDFELKNLISDYKDGNNSRLEAVLKVSREDVSKFRVRFALQQNGDIGVTNVSLRTGSVKDSSWSFAPEDYETIQSKLETEINQTSKKIELKADAEKFDSLTKDYNDNKAKWTLSADKIDSQVKEITKLSEAIEVVKSENSQTAKEIKQSIEKISKDSVSKSEWKLLSDEISGAVKTNKGYGGFKITDKGAILDAEKMYVGIDNQKGFQVVHKDNPTKPILGVSPSGKFEFNALNLDQRFEEANKKIDGIKVGGRNYLLNSQNISVGGVSFKEGSRNEYQALNIQDSLIKNCKNSDIITISFDIETNTGVEFLQVYNTNNKGFYKIETKSIRKIPKGKSRQYVTTTIERRTDTDKQADYIEFYSNYGSSHWYRIDKIKIEGGNRPTDWSPAPEDLENKVDAMEFGGRNYLLQSSRIFSVTNNKENMSYYEKFVKDIILPDNEITISMDYAYDGFKLRAGGQNRIGMEISIHHTDGSQSWLGIWHYPDKDKPKDSGRISRTIRIKNSPIDWGKTIRSGELPDYGIYFQALFGKASITNIKLEKGNKPSDWTSAPEDARQYKAWASSDDGSIGFCKTYPNENLLAYSKHFSASSNNGAVYQVDSSIMADDMGDEYCRTKRINLDKSPTTFSIFNGIPITKSLRDLLKGKKVTVSGMFRAEREAKMNMMVRTVGDVPNLLQGDGDVVTVKREWTQISKTFTSFPEIGEVLRFTPYTLVSPTTEIVSKFYLDAKNFKIEFGDVTPYISQPSEDLRNSVMKYVGFAAKDSNNPSDYEWILSPEYSTAVSEAALNGKVDTNEYENDRDEMFVSLGNKAGMDDLKSVEELANRIQADYEEFIKDGGKYNSDLQAIEDRIAAAVLNLENKVAQLNFINKYIRMGEEGLLIGDSTSLTKILMSDRRISFFDGGKEVAYMEGQEFRINRGTILESLQVGSHKLEQVDKNNTVFTFVR